MKKITNWKYQKWVKEKRYSENSIEDYVASEVTPEDIEAFSIFLLPKTIIYKDTVLLSTYKNESVVRSSYDMWLGKADEESIQAILNKTLIHEIFFYTSEKSSVNTLYNLALLIKHNWEYLFANIYPNRKIVVEIFNEDIEPTITFYEQK